MKSLAGQLLVAMPQMMDPRFARSVVYICAHGEESGAMGLVVNKLLASVTMSELFSHLNLDTPDLNQARPVHFGGPVEPGRGFVLHSADYSEEATLQIDDEFSITATIEILRRVGQGEGPAQSLVALGYAGWAPGQLDAEIQANGWLSVEADRELVFAGDPDTAWERALAKLGVSPLMLSAEAGHA